MRESSDSLFLLVLYFAYTFLSIEVTEMNDKNEVRRGRGRPRKEGDRNEHAFRFNGTEEHIYMKRALEQELHKNGGEVMREALELLYKIKIGCHL